MTTSGDSPTTADNVIEHGKEWSYRACRRLNGGVACEACRRAKNDNWNRAAALRKTKPVPEHLEHGAYVAKAYGCHCVICEMSIRADWAEQKRAQRARKKGAA